MASIHTILKRMREAGEVEYDEQAGTYRSTKFFPSGVTDESFYERIKRKTWMKLWDDNEAKAKAALLAGDEISKLIDSIMDRQRKALEE